MTQIAGTFAITNQMPPVYGSREVINTGTNSYRLRTTRTSRKGAATRPT